MLIPISDMFEAKVETDGKTYRVWNKNTEVTLASGCVDDAETFIIENCGFAPIVHLAMGESCDPETAKKDLLAEWDKVHEEWKKCDCFETCLALEDRMIELEEKLCLI